MTTDFADDSFVSWRLFGCIGMMVLQAKAAVVIIVSVLILGVLLISMLIAGGLRTDEAVNFGPFAVEVNQVAYGY